MRRYLRVLDGVMSTAVLWARAADPNAASDRWRGLYLDQAAAETLAAGGGPLAGFRGAAGKLAAACRQDRGFALLGTLYGLDDFAMAAVALAAAPDLDTRYGRIFGFLQDDVTRRLPSAALAIALFCDGAAEHEAARLALSPGAMLAREHILRADAADGEPSLNAALRLDPQIRQLLLNEPGVDPRLAGICSLRAPRAVGDVMPPAAAMQLQGAANGLRAGRALRLALVGPSGCGQDEAADFLAAASGCQLLSADLRALAASPGNPALLLALLRREALLADAVVRIDNAEALAPELQPLLEAELSRIAPAVLVPTPPGSWLVPAAARSGLAPVPFGPPDAALRARLWQDRLAAYGLTLDTADAVALAARFRLTQRQIAQGVAQAVAALACAPAPPAPACIRNACFAAAPALGGHDLARLSRRIQPRFGWNDLVMTSAMETQLREICARAQHRDTVLGRWGFAEKLALGRGVTALFAGPSGTGKTMAAEVVASTLGIDLFKIDLASVVSKYIGETEKNLDRIFRAAEDVNGILLFDEADALFGKRSEVQDARDRYANLEISYLLQKMEEFEGIAVLSTNLQKNLDDAFTRRLAFIVHFPFPEAAERRRIWDVAWPAGVPRHADLRFDGLARTFKLSGGNIKSAALGAAYLAAAEDAPVSMRHVLRAIEREYGKLGRPLKPAEIAAFLAETEVGAPA